ncbi:hypothetical protein [Laspinema palackyanum]|uniref:hypothetical protein n=1 Tax=Laspinema palackyanum TaxID=3231601 RepID=UPI00345D8F7A|nr:hypothetical protein [Laspinema sp. D2c]
MSALWCFYESEPTDDPHNLHLLSTFWVELIGIDPSFEVGSNFSMNVAIAESVYER